MQHFYVFLIFCTFFSFEWSLLPLCFEFFVGSKSLVSIICINECRCVCVCVYAREKKFLTCTLNFLQGKHIKNKKIARLNKLISFRIWTVWILVSDLLKAKLRIWPIKDLKKNSNVHICIASLTHTECVNKLLVFDGWSLKLLIQHSLRTFTHHVCLACRKKTSSAISLLTLPCSEHVCSLPCQPGQGMLVSSEALILATHVQLH